MATAVVLDTALAQGSRITRFQQPLIGWLGGEQAAERAFLIASLVVGAAITRDILANGSGLQTDPLAICDGLAERLQALVGPTRD